jgi:hypothetical protein
VQIKPANTAQVESPGVISELLERVKLLEERVNVDSSNSSRPPSSNGRGKLNRAQRRTSNHQRGAQPGHKGHSRSMLDEAQVDRLVDCKPQAVCMCSMSLKFSHSASSVTSSKPRACWHCSHYVGGQPAPSFTLAE